MFKNRHPPERLADGLACSHEGIGKIVMRGKETSGTTAERQHHRASQSCHIDDDVGLVLGRAGKTIGHDQAAFGICVVDFHGLAAIHSDDICGSSRSAADHVFCNRHIRGDIDLGTKLCDRTDGRGNCRRTAHVCLHSEHRCWGLHGVATSVKGDSLANQHHMRLCALRAICQTSKSRTVGGTLANTHEAPVAAIRQLLFVKNFTGNAQFTCANHGSFRQICWVKM